MADMTMAPTEPITPIPLLTDADRAAALPPPGGHATPYNSIQRYLLVDRLEAWNADPGTGLQWEGRGRVGTDLNRLWLRSEGERVDGRTDSADLEVLYGRSIAPWWDVVAGVRHDFKPGAAQDFAALGVTRRWRTHRCHSSGCGRPHLVLTIKRGNAAMPIVTRHSLITIAVVAFASLSIVGIFVWSGIYNIGADDTHTKPVYSMLQMVRERSIAARAKKLHPPPNLNDQALIVKGAGNYNAMCMSCHLAPGMADTELSKGLYPAPPNLTQDTVEAAPAFWVIKHGIKASGMPAWGKSMQDEYIWGMVAFLQVLPQLDGEQYQALVDSSGGHDHGGGETTPHGHAEGTPANHHEGAGEHGDMPGMAPKEGEKHVDDHTGAGDAVMHTHADGTRESHPVPHVRAKPATAKPATTQPAATMPDP